ncbi:chemotaxis protein CheW [Dokdonella fugitiva]|jgi:twitching motility protein PilI|uniref:Twitching motility protein PilI n=1 Tax=Dokdonella fugitiva TaxID=328517 RepID=A0A4R2IFX0_9GAMM|nr:chemotaxis protein CheW [Dokdonella fugitiva]MBA8882472.1 twitching motility protein PilI [Dokdonella fugitiva]TCO42729.1 twitching motility protein PilI [Dokdonella fugitiva]
MAAQNYSTTPYEVLAEYEQRSLAHAAGAPEQVDAPGLWRGIGFRIGDRHFVSSIAEVNEILTPPVVTLVPGAKSWLLGVANVRGNLVPVVDLRDFVGGGRSPNTETTRVLVVRQHGGSVGLLVDEVLGQRSFSEEQLTAAVGEADERYNHYVGENVQLGEVQWGLFSMAALVRSAHFQQAAA